MKTSCCTEVCHMCHFVVIFHISGELSGGGQNNVNKHGLRATLLGYLSGQ